MRVLVAALVALGLIVLWLVDFANGEQEKYDACWAKGGVQVKTVKFSNGTVCIDRDAVIKP